MDARSTLWLEGCRPNNFVNLRNQAARVGNLGTIEYLVKHGEDVEGVDSAGRSALHAAVEGGQVTSNQIAN